MLCLINIQKDIKKTAKKVKINNEEMFFFIQSVHQLPIKKDQYLMATRDHYYNYYYYIKIFKRNFIKKFKILVQKISEIYFEYAIYSNEKQTVYSILIDQKNHQLFFYLNLQLFLKQTLQFKIQMDMDQQQEQCVICHQYNDQMLMLTCVHDPCINCAAIHYSQQSRGKIKHHYYTCEICNEKTPLDMTSVIQLQKLAPIQKKITPIRNQPQKKSQFSTPYNFNKNDTFAPPVTSKKYQIERQPRKNSSEDQMVIKDNQNINKPANSNFYNKRTKICRQHSDQQVSYYCFKCLQNICPECAIHGSHQGHNVKSIKKAILDIKKQFGGFIDNMETNQNNYKKIKESHIKAIKQLGQKINRQKSVISKQFEILRGSLVSKERQILKEIDQIHQKNLTLLNNQIQSLNKQLQKSNNFVKSIEVILKRDQITILQQFGKKNQSIKLQLEKFSYNSNHDNNSIMNNIQNINNNEIKENINKMSEFINEIKVESTNGRDEYDIKVQHYLENT